MRIIVRKAEAYSRKSVAVFMAMCLLLSCMVIGLTTVSIGDVQAANSDIYYADATLYDYYYDNENDNSVASRQKDTGEYDPYRVFNSAISNYYEKGSSALTVPLYFGNFFYQNSYTGASYFEMKNFYGLANNLGEDGTDSCTVTQGLLKKGVTPEMMDALPYFNEEFLNNSSNVDLPSRGDSVTVNYIEYLYNDNGRKTKFYNNWKANRTFRWQQDNFTAYINGSGEIWSGAESGGIKVQVENWGDDSNLVELRVNMTCNGKNYTLSTRERTKKGTYFVFSFKYPTITKLGEVYNELKFPFSKNENGHWEFDSLKTSVKYENGILKLQDNEDGRVGTKNLTADYGNYISKEYGYFPFNTGTSSVYGYDSNNKSYNYGFATKMEIEFTLSSDRKVINPKSGIKEDMVFEFSGDDDIWVFIDDKLVLDMGGDHGRATGKINFADETVTYEAHRTLGSSYSTTAEDISSILNSDSSHKYKMTIYYMERGMFESNMHITFNMSLDTSLTIKDVLDTSDVNEKFLSELQKAAEKDIFNYELKNDSKYEGSDVLMYPSNVDVSRENGITTWLSKQNTSNKTKNNFIPDTENKVKNVNFAWADTSGQTTGQVDDLVGQTDGDGILRLMHSQSATFTGQFVIDSNMTVNLTSLTTQGETPKEGGITPLNSNSGRNPSDYYTTTSVVKDADNKDVTVTADGSYKFNNNSGKGNVILTQTFTHKVKTGSLTIEKKVSNDDNTNNEFEFEVVFSDIFGDTTSGTVTESFTLKNGDTKTIEGIPVGAKYTITESPDTGYIVKEIKSSDGTSVTNTVNTETSTGTIPVGNDGVEVKVTYTNELVRNITIAKEVYESDETNRDSDDTTDFTFEITLTKDGAPYTETIATTYTGTTVNNGSRVTINQKQAITLKNVPIDVTVAISEDSAAGYELFAVNDSSSTSVTDSSTSNVTYTFKNKKVSAPAGKATIQIKKYIDELYYGKSDNPHGFSDYSLVLDNKKEVDPHGYEAYTEAEQSFIFKIEKIDSTSKEVLGTAYVVLKFDSNSSRLETVYTPGYVTGEFWYCQETDAFEVDAGYDYKVSEMLDGDNNIAWRYQCPGLNCSYKDGSGGDKRNFDSKGSATNKCVQFYDVEGGDSMEVTFYNLKNTDKSSIEGDMSSKKNEISAA